MKRIVPFIAFSVFVASCGVQSSREADLQKISSAPVVVMTDTAGIADYKAFQEWKRSKQAAEFGEQPAMRVVEKPVYVVRNTGSRSTSSNTGSSNNKVEDRADYPGSTSTDVSQPVEEKKGWSKAAKGAAIGAGSGAVIGAVVNKRNRAVGAVIGGVVGGAAGYGIGRHMDKKDGRY